MPSFFRSKTSLGVHWILNDGKWIPTLKVVSMVRRNALSNVRHQNFEFLSQKCSTWKRWHDSHVHAHVLKARLSHKQQQKQTTTTNNQQQPWDRTTPYPTIIVSYSSIKRSSTTTNGGPAPSKTPSKIVCISHYLTMIITVLIHSSIEVQSALLVKSIVGQNRYYILR